MGLSKNSYTHRSLAEGPQVRENMMERTFRAVLVELNRQGEAQAQALTGPDIPLGPKVVQARLQAARMAGFVSSTRHGKITLWKLTSEGAKAAASKS